MHEIRSNIKSPKFNHKEIEWLYNDGLSIGEEKLRTILSLPKETLSSDLELILQDSIARFGYFKNSYEEEELREEEIHFVVHAIYLLGELEARGSLEAVFKVLSQSDEYLKLYLGYFLTELLWEPLNKIAGNNLKECKQFILQPGIDTYARSAILDMVKQIALHKPERREEVLLWFAEIIQSFLNSKSEDEIIDYELNALLICNIIDLNGSELIPHIEKLFEKSLVSEGICGDWKEVKEAFERAVDIDKPETILPMTERYSEVLLEWSGYNEANLSSHFDEDNYFDLFESSFQHERKIGRNETCLCGSGKKYKKCCMKK